MMHHVVVPSSRSVPLVFAWLIVLFKALSKVRDIVVEFPAKRLGFKTETSVISVYRHNRFIGYHQKAFPLPSQPALLMLYYQIFSPFEHPFKWSSICTFAPRQMFLDKNFETNAITFLCRCRCTKAFRVYKSPYNFSCTTHDKSFNKNLVIFISPCLISNSVSRSLYGFLTPRKWFKNLTQRYKKEWMLLGFIFSYHLLVGPINVKKENL